MTRIGTYNLSFNLICVIFSYLDVGHFYKICPWIISNLIYKPLICEQTVCEIFLTIKLVILIFLLIISVLQFIKTSTRGQ